MKIVQPALQQPMSRQDTMRVLFRLQLAVQNELHASLHATGNKPYEAIQKNVDDNNGYH